MGRKIVAEDVVIFDVRTGASGDESDSRIARNEDSGSREKEVRDISLKAEIIKGLAKVQDREKNEQDGRAHSEAKHTGNDSNASIWNSPEDKSTPENGLKRQANGHGIASKKTKISHRHETAQTTLVTAPHAEALKVPEDYRTLPYLPTMLLYDNDGLKLFDKITYLHEYYLTNAEIEILTSQGQEIADRILQNFLSPDKHPQKDKMEEHYDKVPQKKLNQRWGDQVVGRHNNGVNGEATRSQSAQAQSNGMPQSSSLGPETACCIGTVVELGSGSLRKSKVLLQSISKQLSVLSAQHNQKLSIEYYALDLDYKELLKSLAELKGALKAQGCTNISCLGLWGTYESGFAWLAGANDNADVTESISRPRAVLFLGSSIGNFNRPEAASFLALVETSGALRPKDLLIVGVDGRNDPETIALAYNDPSGVTAQFEMNALKHLNSIFNRAVVDLEAFEYVAGYNEKEGRHEAYLRARNDLIIEFTAEDLITSRMGDLASQAGSSLRLEFRKDQLLHLECSYKYDSHDFAEIVDASNLRSCLSWSDRCQRYRLWCLEKDEPVHFTSAHPISELPRGFHGQDDISSYPSRPTSTRGVPSTRDWDRLNRWWDVISTEMITDKMLHVKPIDLRHVCLFYLGHIPCFADINLTKCGIGGNELTKPHKFARIFERGIDPNVDDPSLIHRHSEVPANPEDWPSKKEILDYDSRVRARIYKITAQIEFREVQLTRKLGRLLAMIFEHQILHGETLLYMLVQSPMTSPPSGVTGPVWAKLAAEWDRLVKAEEAGRARFIEYETQAVSLGHDDDETADDGISADAQNGLSQARGELSQQESAWTHEYGWDNEHPVRRVQTSTFKISATPVSNLEYLQVLLKRIVLSVDGGFAKTNTNASAAIRGIMTGANIPASWCDTSSNKIDPERIAGIIERDNMTIASLPEIHPDLADLINVRSLFGPVPFAAMKHWPVQCSYDQLSAHASAMGGRVATEAEIRLFLDDADHNVTSSAVSNTGFRHWHPVPASVRDKHNGGVWEWTSTPFDTHDGFKPMALYPEYSADFFDGKHNVVVGGCWATHPRVAGRRSFRNWYQKNYPYVFAGGRVVLDAATSSNGAPSFGTMEAGRMGPAGLATKHYTSG